MANSKDTSNPSRRSSPQGAPELQPDDPGFDGRPTIVEPSRVNLDGTNRQTVLGGTGKEEEASTVDSDTSESLADEPDEFANLEHGLDDIPDADQSPARPGHIKRFFGAYWHRKKWALPLTVLLIVAALAAVPWTRYAILSQFITKSFQVQLTDAKTGKPISGAKLTVGQETVTTDSKGAVTLHAKVGRHRLSIDKKYYATYDANIFVGLKAQSGPQVLSLTATGRQVPLTVVNKITGKPIENATLKAAGTEVKTDKDGKVSMVLPADQSTLNITVGADGYISLQTTVQVSELAVAQNTYGITPNGQISFLSKLSGKIDVVKTNLDGTNRQTVLGGTGKEEDASTQLLASRDWKYLALLSKRGSEGARLYLVSTDTGKLTTIDNSDSSFQLVGWTDHNFSFVATRNQGQYSDPNHTAVKTFDADSGKTLTLDQNQSKNTPTADVYYQSFTTVYQLGNNLVYGVTWAATLGQVSGEQSSIRVASLKDQTKKDIKTFDNSQTSFFYTQPSKPNEIYFASNSQPPGSLNLYEISNGGNGIDVKTSNVDSNSFYQQSYATYLTSPSGDHTFWTEQRDGRNVFFVGDSMGDNGKEITTLDDYDVYGWYTDNYLLVSKKGSELYILPATGGTPLKITDYHKPAVSLRGYGGGYGGL